MLQRPVESGQFTSVRFTERPDEIGAKPSIGTVADSYDNALAESTNGLFKTECVYESDVNGWDDVDELELATLSWSTGSANNGFMAAEMTYHQQNSSQRSTLPNNPSQPGLETNKQSLHQTQGDSGPHEPVPLMQAL